MTSTARKAVVVYGGFTHEGISTAVKALGFELRERNLKQIVAKTWEKRISEVRELRENSLLAAAIFYLHSHLYLEVSAPESRELFFRLIDECKHAKSIIFSFQDNLDGEFAPRDPVTGDFATIGDLQAWESYHSATRYYETEKFHFERGLESIPEPERARKSLSAPMQPTEPARGPYVDEYHLDGAIARAKEAAERKLEIADFTSMLFSCGIEIAPFSARADVTVRLQEFFEDLEQGVFLRLFVPSDRYQAEQLKSLLAVLERYLKQVERREFLIDARKSDKGTTYIFRLQNTTGDVMSQMDAAFERFDSFMRLCGDNPESAAKLMTEVGFSQPDADYNVSRYAKEYQRVLLDARHELERKMLALKQRFESDGIETTGLMTLESSALGLSNLLSESKGVGGLQLNIGSLSIVNADRVSGEIQRVFHGDVVYSNQDNELLRLLGSYGERIEALQGQSDLHQLKDSSIPETAKISAGQRLKTFLRRAASKAAEVGQRIAVDALSSYIESLAKSSG